jgi:hypothetical protein
VPQSQVNFHNSARFYQNLLTHSYYSCANFSTLQFGNWHACELPAESRTNTSTRATTIGHQPATKTSTASTTANGYTAHTGQPGENQKGAVEAKKAFRNGGLWSALPDVGVGWVAWYLEWSAQRQLSVNIRVVYSATGERFALEVGTDEPGSFGRR